ncbi:hypothetical protein PRIPAC_88910 [Pristionchus pacificus]|uniref:Uncharacterized protein n=1 Tax=Pristionchus pacificus TaxID=54126 RepID=A0A2A6CTS6_PRIPA|nr:hypothetical protein PRIPAC_88910 [Pristionchus pacificus]|eukprot:PDM81518.1 hypothetical protein PRIPAC_35394 [Pristionchus pacificus]
MQRNSTRIPRSASPSRSSTRRVAMIVTSPFFSYNRFSILPVDRCPITVLVDRSSSTLRRSDRRKAIRDDLRNLAEDLRREEEEGARAAVAPSFSSPGTSPIKQATTTYRRYFYGYPPQELYSLSEMRVADEMVESYIPTARRVAGRRMSVERPLRERVLRLNLLRSLTVLEFKTTHSTDERSEWDMEF